MPIYYRSFNYWKLLKIFRIHNPFCCLWRTFPLLLFTQHFALYQHFSLSISKKSILFNLGKFNFISSCTYVHLYTKKMQIFLFKGAQERRESTQLFNTISLKMCKLQSRASSTTQSSTTARNALMTPLSFPIDTSASLKAARETLPNGTS